MDGDEQALAMRGLCRTGMRHAHRARHRWRPPARTAAHALLPARVSTPSAVAAIRGAQTPPARCPRAAHQRASRGERRFPSLRSRRPARGAPLAGARPPRATAVAPVRARARRNLAAGAPPDVPCPSGYVPRSIPRAAWRREIRLPCCSGSRWRLEFSLFDGRPHGRPLDRSLPAVAVVAHGSVAPIARMHYMVMTTLPAVCNSSGCIS